MKKQLTKEEQLIKYFITQFENSKTNEVTISKADLPELNLSEQEASRYIHLLQGECLDITQKSVHNDFSMSWTITLKPPCIYYFDNKRAIRKEKCNNWIQFWIPVSLSAIAIIVSIVALVLGQL